MTQRGSELGAGASWLSAVLLVAPLALLAELLIVRTHHRPLAAVTFACVAVAFWALAELLSRRVLDPSLSRARARARLWTFLAGGCAVAGIIARALL